MKAGRMDKTQGSEKTEAGIQSPTVVWKGVQPKKRQDHLLQIAENPTVEKRLSQVKQ